MGKEEKGILEKFLFSVGKYLSKVDKYTAHMSFLLSFSRYFPRGLDPYSLQLETFYPSILKNL